MGRGGSGALLPPGLLAALAATVAAAEALASGAGTGPGADRLRGVAISWYLPLRRWLAAHPAPGGAAAALLIAGALLAYRAALVAFRNRVAARLAGTHFGADPQRFPERRVDLLPWLGRRPPAHTFVGLSPRRRLLGWRWEPVYVSERQRTSHRHVLGKTGSGKTQGVLFPQVLQDVLDGKGCVVVSGKGSDEEIATVKGIVRLAGREADLRVFALPAWSRPGLESHAYNMLHVDPRGPDDPGGDPEAVAERVFSALPLGEHPYYNAQALAMTTALCRLLHGVVDEAGRGFVFTMRDLAVCLKGVGRKDAPCRCALDHCLERSVDRDAARDVLSQIDRLGHEVHRTLSGLVGAVDRFQSPLVNACDPGIVMREVLERNLVVYLQLPANLYKVQAPALGKVFLMDIQQEGSLRQVHRRTRNQRPFSVVVDEFGRFADLTFVDSLNQLRDANLQFTVAHQSLADLEMVSREFATAVWDNTRVKDLLSQDNPALCEMVARSIGTQHEVRRTVRSESGPLLTSLATREASSELVESYRLHPNRIKNLARCGQGYLYTDSALHPVCYPELPPLQGGQPLPRPKPRGWRGLCLHERFVAGGAGGEPG